MDATRVVEEWVEAREGMEVDVELEASSGGEARSSGQEMEVSMVSGGSCGGEEAVIGIGEGGGVMTNCGGKDGSGFERM